MLTKGQSRREVSKLLDCLSEEIEKQQPENVIHFMVDFLCKNYASHLKGFAHVWDVDLELEKEKKLVIEFFKSQKLTTEIAKHFINVGFDSMESIVHLNAHILDDVEKFNKQMFSNIEENVKRFFAEYENDNITNRRLDYCNFRVNKIEKRELKYIKTIIVFLIIY
ncbi:conserved Plasmodium protein, unknown function [Plasmodium malariae]|uniref:Uncharacterized protein n=1 Tax=Plasmodium malariae TaxID=5858 RepID=A0A1D3JM31_PLAMA|nr:conserved Plasmodium protein, unknown function [Plasmodium malariae]SBT87730.1 conserved Plasmodium protein, unknown function [Plasmodium malariae]